ncbi:MAG: 6-carboxytetrahydropterin synthase [Planctomycetota bacterium]
MFEITVETVFAAAHALRLPDGSFEPIHGHNWPVAVTVWAEQLDAIEAVMDFHELQRIVEQIVTPWRNTDLNRCAPFADGRGGLVINPSAERVAWHIGQQTAKQLPEGCRLVSVSVGEAPGCTARYRPQ